jgi:hypothetical protein
MCVQRRTWTSAGAESSFAGIFRVVASTDTGPDSSLATTHELLSGWLYPMSLTRIGLFLVAPFARLRRGRKTEALGSD